MGGTRGRRSASIRTIIDRRSEPGSAFDRVENSFQFLVNSWGTIVELLSIYKRLHAFEATIRGDTDRPSDPVLGAEMNQLLDLTVPPLSLVTLAVNLALTIVLATVVAWFYSEYGRSLSNRARFAQTLPVLALTTVLIISIVKSSLALSLGLVGALSIVRFRTAIKEPEELAYLFLAIAIGLGMGAEQQVATILAVSVILLYLYGRARLNERPLRNNLYVNVVAPDQEHAFSALSTVLARHSSLT